MFAAPFECALYLVARTLPCAHARVYVCRRGRLKHWNQQPPRGEEEWADTTERQWVFRTTVFFFYHVTSCTLLFFISLLIDKAGWCKCDDLPCCTHAFTRARARFVTRTYYNISYDTILYIYKYYARSIIRAREPSLRVTGPHPCRLIWLSFNEKRG